MLLYDASDHPNEKPLWEACRRVDDALGWTGNKPRLLAGSASNPINCKPQRDSSLPEFLKEWMSRGGPLRVTRKHDGYGVSAEVDVKRYWILCTGRKGDVGSFQYHPD